MSSAVGKALHQKRMELGLSIEDISTKTKIPKATIEAIENNQQELLPARPFLRGFIRTYAKIVGLDADQVIELFEQDNTAVPAPLPPTQSQEDPMANDEPSSDEKSSVLWFQASKSFFMAMGLLVTIFMCAVIYFTLQKVSSYNEESLVVENKLEEKVAAAVGPLLTEQKLENLKTSDEQESPLANSDKTEEVAPQVPKDKPADKKVAPAAQAPPQIQAKIAPVKPVTKPIVDHKVSVHALKPVDLTVVWNSGASQTFGLESNEIKHIVFKKPITLRISNAGVVKLVFDGQALDTSDSMNQPIELKYP